MPSGARCCIINCKATSHNKDGSKNDENGLRFFSIPAVKQHLGEETRELTRLRRLAWVAAIRRPDVTFERLTVGLRVCSKHFHKGAPAYERLKNDPDWAPSLHLGHSEVPETNVARHARVKRRRELSNQTAIINVGATNAVEVSSQCDAMCQTDLTTTDIANLEDENKKLREKLNNKKFNLESFHNDKKVKYFTGLTSLFTFMHLFDYLKPHLPPKRAVTPFQMLLVVFLRLRLNLPVQFIAYFYGIHRTTTQNIFIETLSVMYTRMSPMIVWPSRECLKASMPHEFTEAFGSNVAVIIDCFEVFIEKPSNMLAQSQTFSHYKHNHTMKYLIGVTPQGVVSFIPKGWGGRTSDKHITENSGFLNNLQPQDIVLADRGFDIKESVGLMCAEVLLPAFTRGKCQMEARNIEETRKLAHLRIHVERVIGTVVGKYTILSDTVPLNLVLHCEGEKCTILDKIVTVACVLTNLCPSVVHNVNSEAT